MGNKRPTEKSLANLKPFVKGHDPRRNVSGQPRKIAATVIEFGYTNSEIQETLKNISALTEKEVETLANNPECNVLERTVCKALLQGLKKGSLYNLETVITRAFGKPLETQQAQVDNKIEVVFVQGKSIT